MIVVTNRHGFASGAGGPWLTDARDAGWRGRPAHGCFELQQLEYVFLCGRLLLRGWTRFDSALSTVVADAVVVVVLNSFVVDVVNILHSCC